MTFDDPLLPQWLGEASQADVDELPFGAIGLNTDNYVEVYGRFESSSSGLSCERVVGRHFFYEVAPCMNNYLVAERFASEDKLDATINYVLTFRMRPTPVRLRLVQVPGQQRRWIAIDRG